jgi:hypothetical protein
MCVTAVAVLSWIAVFSLVDAFRWWFEYGIGAWNAQL